MVVINIGSTSISAALVAVGPKILKTARLSFAPNEKPRGESIAIGISKSLTEVLKKLEKNNDYKIEKVVVSFASPWYEAKTKNIKLEEKERPFLINENFIKNILEREKNSYEREAGEGVCAECDITSIRINGYEISSFIDKKANILEMDLYLSVIDRSIFKKVYSVLKTSRFAVENISVHSLPYAGLNIVKKLFPEEKNFIFLDFSGELTELSFIINGKFNNTVSFPSGHNAILRKISRHFSISTQISQSMLYSYLKNKLNTETSEKIKKIIEDVIHEWSAHFEIAQQKFPKYFPLAHIFVAAEETYTAFIKKTLEYNKNSVLNDMIILNKEFLESKFERGSLVAPEISTAILALLPHEESISN